MSRALKHNGGYIRHTAAGTYRAEVSHAYRTHRQTCATVADARRWIDVTQAQFHSAAAPLSAGQYDDARAALALLPSGATLCDAARAYATAQAGPEQVWLADVIRAYLTRLEAQGRAERTLQDYGERLNRLVNTVAVEYIGDITADHLSAALDAWDVRGPTRNSYRRVWHALFAYAVRAGHIRANPADGLDIIAYAERMPEYVSVEDAAGLMSWVERNAPEWIAYYALGLFAGVRPAELARLDMTACSAEHVRIGPEIAKIRRARLIPCEPNLVAWLRLCPPDGPVRPTTDNRSAYASMTRHRSLAGVVDWPHDAARHSYATYHLALYHDAALTNASMGHTSADILFRHYRGLASEADAKRYFTLAPSI